MRPAESRENSTLGEISRRLREHGVTPTAQRIQIAAALFARPQHVSADQVLALTNEGGGRPVSKATVYNTLGLFARKGLIRELLVDPARVYYDSSTHPHSHFFNLETQELSDIDPTQISVELPTILPEGTEIAGAEVIVYLRPGRTS